MKVKLRRNSWHYWLASNLGGDVPDSYRMKQKTRNFCAYSRAVFANLLLLLALVTVVSAFCVPLFVLPIYMWITHQYDKGSIDAVKAAWAGVGFIVLGVGLGYLGYQSTTWVRNRHEEHEPSQAFLWVWLRSVKDKVCFLVEFED